VVGRPAAVAALADGRAVTAEHLQLAGWVLAVEALHSSAATGRSDRQVRGIRALLPCKAFQAFVMAMYSYCPCLVAPVAGVVRLNLTSEPAVAVRF
jgi:hypothetical protein